MYLYIAGLQKQFPVCSCMGDSGRELHPGDKQLAAGVEEVQIVAAEITCSATKGSHGRQCRGGQSEQSEEVCKRKFNSTPMNNPLIYLLLTYSSRIPHSRSISLLQF